MRRIILKSVACLAVPYFPTSSHTLHYLPEKIKGIEENKRVFAFLYKISLKNFSL
jgi:hypothetical protein